MLETYDKKKSTPYRGYLWSALFQRSLLMPSRIAPLDALWSTVKNDPNSEHHSNGSFNQENTSEHKKATQPDSIHTYQLTIVTHNEDEPPFMKLKSS
jgi:hypothetical protein